MFIDQQAAHERILFEKYLLQLKGVAGNSQQSLVSANDQTFKQFFSLLELRLESEISNVFFQISRTENRAHVFHAPFP